MGIIDNIVYAFTGKKPDRSKNWLRLSADVVFPDNAPKRDRFDCRDRDYFLETCRFALGFARYSLVQDRRTGEKSHNRAYLRQVIPNYLGYMVAAYSGGNSLEEIKRIIP